MLCIRAPRRCRGCPRIQGGKVCGLPCKRHANGEGLWEIPCSHRVSTSAVRKVRVHAWNYPGGTPPRDQYPDGLPIKLEGEADADWKTFYERCSGELQEYYGDRPVRSLLPGNPVRKKLTAMIRTFDAYTH